MKESVPAFYCVVQYMHDLTRGEVVNVGVLLYCPALDVLDVRLTTSLERVQRFFGPDLHEDLLRSLITGFGPRILVIEKPYIRSLADLEHFVNTRANHMVLTPPRPMVVVDSPAASLDHLFRYFVAEPSELSRPPALAAVQGVPSPRVESTAVTETAAVTP